MSSGLKLDELATRAGVSARTVRYYIQRGVLPAAEFRGPDTAYDERHLHALRAIKRLQEAYWPLDAIAAELAGKDVGELRTIAERGLPAPAPEKPAVAKPTELGTSERQAEGTPEGLKSVRGERVSLSRGVELWVEEGADRALVEAIVELSKSWKARKA